MDLKEIEIMVGNALAFNDACEALSVHDFELLFKQDAKAIQKFFIATGIDKRSKKYKFAKRMIAAMKEKYPELLI
jgi:hypothetical protein